MNKRNWILVGILVVQLALAAVVFWPRSRAAEGGQALFPGIEAEQITGLTVSASDGKSVQLAKAAGGWVLPGVDDFPVKSDEVPPLLTKMLELKAGRPVATTAASQSRLKVAPDEYERLVEFQLADGGLHRLYVGTSPSYGASHVRADEQTEVYLAPDLSAQNFGAEPSAWVDRAYLAIPADQVTGMTLQNSQGTLDFEKTEGQWTMKGLATGETLDNTKVTGLLNRVNPLTMLRPLGKTDKQEYGLQQPAAILTLKTQDDRIYTLKVGSQDPTDKSYVVISSESPYYVRVSEYSAQDLLQGRDGFLLQPTPTPTPAPTATPQS